jgi:hypothetical protein
MQMLADEILSPLTVSKIAESGLTPISNTGVFGLPLAPFL